MRYRRIVVKAGTSVLTSDSEPRGLNGAVVSDLVRQICWLRERDAEVLLVTSGAIAAGRQVLHEAGPVSTGEQPERDITSRQVLAAVGQSRLMHTYQQLFDAMGFQVAQTLLTINDLSDRQAYLNVGNTLTGLLELGVIPIVNENDVVAVDEIGEVFGDNDRLSALVANLVDADLLVILTDIDGLYTADPNQDHSATLIPLVTEVDEKIEALAGKELNPWARGGMSTKLEAARLVTTSGVAMVMCQGTAQDAILKAAGGEGIGTLFQPAAEKLEARKRWMLGGISQKGEVRVDAGASRAVRESNRSLLPAGIQAVEGEFRRGDIIFIAGPGGRRIACGIANYRSGDIARIQGVQSGQISGILGYDYGQEVVHRNNLVLL
ncbi:MAG: glutamate 5-kinase [SAR202 cluster bacterium Io17-Chloro-G2]|nr:MAG: glutamate 5-kinase [SAR202 cluster bacterium Io17-Chloro-G2]